jgi:hypothetical protein
MTNHIHLVLQVSDIPLSLSMQNLSFRYTKWINWRLKRTGHLFQGRYKAVLVDGDSYLMELVRYIHLNPVRAGMVKDPEEYPWSSHRIYLGKESLPSLTTDWLLEHFSKTSAEAREGYRNFVLDGLGEERRPEFYGIGEDSRLLGNDSFVEKCLSSTVDTPLRVTAREIADKVCLTYEIDMAMLKSPSQYRKISEARAVVGWLAREFGCVTLSDVGRLVSRDVGSISSAVHRLSNRMLEDPELAEKIQSLKESMTKLSILEA